MMSHQMMSQGLSEPDDGSVEARTIAKPALPGTPEQWQALDDALASRAGQPGAMIGLLQAIQEIYGYLPRTVLEEVARRTKTPLSRVYGVATFYAQFRLVPRGQNIIRVCVGTACHVRGGARILQRVEDDLEIKPQQTTKDQLFTLEPVACLGACGLAPVMMINERPYGKLTPDKVSRILKQYQKAAQP